MDDDENELNDYEMSVPILTPGTRVLIQVREESYMADQHGRWVRVCNPQPPFWATYEAAMDCCDREPRDVAIDRVTVCSWCIESWRDDHLMTLGETLADLGLRV